MNQRLNFISGIGLGAGLMYLLDPDRGRRRRALARDKANSVLGQTQEALAKTSRDVNNRAQGLASKARSLLEREPVDDEVLVERVRSAIGRLVSHPGAIEVAVREGKVTLSGPVLADELDDLISGVSSVRGVCDVENRLEAHEQPGDVPGLQGGRTRRPLRRFELFQANWSPALRLAVGATGAVMGAGILARRLGNRRKRWPARYLQYLGRW